MSGPFAWLRRYARLFGLLSVLLLAFIVGLLVGHWVTQSKAPSQQVLKVEGLTARRRRAAATPTSPAATSTTPASATPTPASKAAGQGEDEEAKPKKAGSEGDRKNAAAKRSKSLDQTQETRNTTGKKHEEEVNKISDEPIETGS